MSSNNDVSLIRRSIIMFLHELPVALAIHMGLIVALHLMSFIPEMADKYVEIHGMTMLKSVEELAQNEFIYPFASDLSFAALIFIPVVVFLPLRLGIRNKFLCAASHVIAAAGFIIGAGLIPEIEKVIPVYVVFIIITMLTSLTQGLWPAPKEESFADHMVLRIGIALGICSIITIITRFSGEDQFFGLFFAYTLLSITCMVLFQHLQRVNENISRVGHNLTEKPLAGIARTYNNRLIAGIAAVLMVAAASMFFVRPEFGSLPEIGLARKSYESADRTEREEDDSFTFTLPEWLLPAQTERPQEEMAYRPPPPKRRYEQYLGVLAGIVQIIIIVIMIRSVFNRKKKDKSGDPYDIISLTTPDTEKKQTPAARPGLFLTPNQRVRRMFYKEVDGRRRSGLSLTPSSTSVTIANDIGEDISRLEGYYRLARYSGKELTKEDVAEIKRKG